MVPVWCSVTRQCQREYYHPFFFSPVGTEAHGNLLTRYKSLCQSWNFNLDLLSLCSAISIVSVKADLNFCHISEGSRPQASFSFHTWTAMPQSWSQWQEALSLPAGKISVFIIFSTCVLEGYLCRLRSSHVTLLCQSSVMVPAAEYLQCFFDPQLWREIYQRRGEIATAVFSISIYLYS